MIKTESFNKYSTIVDKNSGESFISCLPLSLIEEIIGYFQTNGVKIEEGSIFEKNDNETLSCHTKMTGVIFLKPLIKADDENALQLIPIYKEEVSFANRMGWRRLVNMFKYLTPGELLSDSYDRYNIITDVDGRRNCF